MHCPAFCTLFGPLKRQVVVFCENQGRCSIALDFFFFFWFFALHISTKRAAFCLPGQLLRLFRSECQTAGALRVLRPPPHSPFLACLGLVAAAATKGLGPAPPP